MAANIMILKKSNFSLLLRKFLVSTNLKHIPRITKPRHDKFQVRSFSASSVRQKEEEEEEFDKNKPYKFSTSKAKTHTVATTLGYIGGKEHDKYTTTNWMIFRMSISTLVMAGGIYLATMEEGPVSLKVRHILEGKETLEEILQAQLDQQREAEVETTE